jgi:hypothetical protein
MLSWIARIKQCIFNHYRFSTKEKGGNEVFMFLDVHVLLDNKDTTYEKGQQVKRQT